MTFSVSACISNLIPDVGASAMRQLAEGFKLALNAAVYKNLWFDLCAASTPSYRTRPNTPESSTHILLRLCCLLGFQRLLPIALDHDQTKEASDDSAAEEKEDDGNSDRPNSRQE